MHPRDRGDINWRKLEAMARRGWGRFGGGGPGGRGFGDWGGFGDNFRIGRMLASGDLRLVALYLIEEQPRHGYDLIKAIEEKTGGLYVPSPGIVYPALTFLEEAGFVSSTAEGNKRLYTITDEGKAHLASNREAVDGTLEHLRRVGEQFHRMREQWSEAERGWPSHVSADVADGPSGAQALDADEVAERMSGNLCRCGAYVGIVDAILQAAGAPARAQGGNP